MTTTTTRTSEQIEQELEEAKEAERSLAEEANRTTDRLRAAASEEKLDLQEAAIAGRSPKEASPLSKARRRAEELPALLWAASLGRLELELQYQTRMTEAADREKKEAHAEVHEIDQRIQKLREIQEDARDRLHVANSEWHDHNRAKGEARRQLAALEARGPDFDLLKRSSLRPRP
jgi:hypothetical protein